MNDPFEGLGLTLPTSEGESDYGATYGTHGSRLSQSSDKSESP